MSTTEPIRSKKDLMNFKEYYEVIRPNSRNAMLVTIGLNTALRIGDILKLKWKDVYDFDRKRVKQHIRIYEQKTGKENIIAINHMIRVNLETYRKEYMSDGSKDYLFQSRKVRGTALSRYQAFRIIKEAAAHAGIEEHISCHSLRKTFGYHAWKQGIQPAMLMNIFNHSSYQITKRYLCIEQDDKDAVFRKVTL